MRINSRLFFLGFCISFLMISTSRASSSNLCFEEASVRYRVNKFILMAIAKTESGFNPKAVNLNKGGTRDIGIMQINSVHLPELLKFGITENRLFSEPCTNIHVGAWILSKYMVIHGNTWKAVGSYNTGPRGSSANQAIYVRKVTKSLNALGVY